MQDNVSSRTVAAVVNDLMFASRIRSAAEQAGVRAVFVRAAGALREAVAGADLVLLDLETRWLDAASTIAELKADPATAGVPIIAFGSHVEGQALIAAREAGADRVLARSSFVKMLPDLLLG